MNSCESVSSNDAPLGFDSERTNTALRRCTPEVGEEKVILVTVRESHTRVMGQPGRAVRNVYDRGDHVGGLTLVGRVPDLFPV